MDITVSEHIPLKNMVRSFPCLQLPKLSSFSTTEGLINFNVKTQPIVFSHKANITDGLYDS